MNKYVLGAIIILVLILALKIAHTEMKLEEQLHLNEVLADTMVAWKDEKGKTHAKIQVFETQGIKSFTNLKTNDSLVKELQLLVKNFSKELKNSGSATIIKTETIHDTSFITEGLSDDSLSIMLPYYRGRKDKWIDYSFTIKKDRTDFSLKVNNEYNIVIGEEKQGTFKPRKSYVEVISSNPYNTVKKVRSYQKVRADKRFSVGPMIGIDLKLQPTIGVGVVYGLIKF